MQEDSTGELGLVQDWSLMSGEARPSQPTSLVFNAFDGELRNT